MLHLSITEHFFAYSCSVQTDAALLEGDTFLTAAFLSSALDLYHFWAAFCLMNPYSILSLFLMSMFTYNNKSS
jgi:hypothetical protein